MEATPQLSPHPRICVVVCGGATGIQQGLSLLRGQNGCHDPVRGEVFHQRWLHAWLSSTAGSQAGLSWV